MRASVLFSLLLLLTSCYRSHELPRDGALDAPADTTSGEAGPFVPTGLELQEGDIDFRYEVRRDEGPWLPARVERGNFCSSCGRVWLWHPGPNEIGPDAPLQHPECGQEGGTCPDTLFSWRTRFSLPEGVEPSRATIRYEIGWDDRSLDPGGVEIASGHYVWLNGESYFTPCSGNPYRAECTGEIPSGAAFRSGINTLEWRIQNGATYHGFRIRNVEVAEDS